MTATSVVGGYTAKAADLDIVLKFERDVAALQRLLGVSDVQVLAPGTNLKTYTNTITFQDGTANPGAAITASTIATVAAQKELTFKKWVMPVPIESIAKQGYEGAVVAADNQLLTKVQGVVRGDIVTSLASGSGTASGVGFQAALAATWAKVMAAFEDEAATPVYFANYADVASYLGAASVTVQTESGIAYIENFMGIPGRLIIDNNVASGKIYGTAAENICIAAADVSGIEGMELTMDESGMIAVHHDPAYGNAALNTVVYCGLCVFPMYAARVIKGTISNS